MTPEQAEKITIGTRLVDKDNPEWGIGIVKDRGPQGLTIVWSNGPVEYRPFRYFATIEIARRDTK